MAGPQRVSILVTGTIVTVDPKRRVLRNGAVAVDEGEILAVGDRSEVEARYEPTERLGGPDALVIPGLINAHQHLTGDRLIRSAIPDKVSLDTAIFDWVMPVHEAHDPADDELTATLALVESLQRGITTTVEAGTVAHPDRVMAAFGAVGVRGVVGTWGWDIEGAPYAFAWPEVIERQRATVSAARVVPLVDGWVTLVGHDTMSDELVTAASELARELESGLAFHMSPGAADPESYVARTGRRPLQHLQDLGVLGEHVLVAHCVHLDQDEVDIVIDTNTAVVYCPWAYLRLGQGVTRVGRHLEMIDRGGRVALGCDSENAGDSIDMLDAARLAAGLARDGTMDPQRFGAHEAFELATLGGARALRMSDEVGSLETGKRADIVVIERRGVAWEPVSEDPVLQLVWGSHSESVRDVVVDGAIVLRDRTVRGLDVPVLLKEASRRRSRLLERAGIVPAPGWPAV